MESERRMKLQREGSQSSQWKVIGVRAQAAKGMRRESLSKAAWSFECSGLFQCKRENLLSEARTQAGSVWKEIEMRN